MERKKMKSCTLYVVFWGLLILPVNGERDCVIRILPSLTPCQESFLSIPLPSKPSAECCAAAKEFSTLGTTAKLCGCLKLDMLSSPILHAKLNSIPHLCNIPALLPVINCATATDGGFELKRNKNVEVNAFRPTTPGHGPGIGHQDILSMRKRTTPGHSPGIGHTIFDISHPVLSPGN